MRKDLLEKRRAFNEAMRARIRLFARERNLPSAEVKKVMGLKHYEVMLFAERHRMNYDWLLCGDLKGLLEMVREKRSPDNEGAGSGPRLLVTGA